jgi:hypothetical protein
MPVEIDPFGQDLEAFDDEGRFEFGAKRAHGAA